MTNHTPPSLPADKQSEADSAKHVTRTKVEPEWLHREIQPHHILTYWRRDEECRTMVASKNDDWTMIRVSSRIPMHGDEIEFERYDRKSMLNYFSTIALIQQAFELGQNAKAEEFRKCLNIKESR